MPMNESSCISAIESELTGKGFKLDEAPRTKEFIEIIVTNVLAEVKKATVSVPAQGLVAPTNGGPVTGSANGTIS